MQNAFEERIEKLKENCDENSVKKIEEIKTLITNSHASIKQTVSIHFILFNLYLNEN